MSEHRRSLTITAALIRDYSRRGNYHSDPAIAASLALPGLVAQGMQAAGPAYGELLDAWGEDFLARGELECTFVGPVLAGATVEARVAITGTEATFEVADRTGDRTAVVGSARVTP